MAKKRKKTWTVTEDDIRKAATELGEFLSFSKEHHYHEMRDTETGREIVPGMIASSIMRTFSEQTNS